MELRNEILKEHSKTQYLKIVKWGGGSQAGVCFAIRCLTQSAANYNHLYTFTLATSTALFGLLNSLKIRRRDWSWVK